MAAAFGNKAVRQPTGVHPRDWSGRDQTRNWAGQANPKIVRRLLWGRSAAAVEMAAVGSGRESRHVVCRWTQGSFDRTLRSLVPGEWLRDFQMPYVEDLCNHHVFHRYRNWLRKEGLAYIDPSEVKKPLGGTTAWAAGLQRGVLSSKHAVAPVVGYGVEATAHSAMATDAARMGVHPWSR